MNVYGQVYEGNNGLDIPIPYQLRLQCAVWMDTSSPSAKLVMGGNICVTLDP